MQITAHLTSGNPDFEERIRVTHDGQAHWADSAVNTCRECACWGFADEPFKRACSGRLLALPCTKFRELTGKKGPRVPHYAHACKFFERNPDAPSVFGKSSKRAQPEKDQIMSNALTTADDGWNSVPATTSGILRGQRMKLQQDGHYYLAKSTEPFFTEQDLVVVGVVTAWQRWQDKKIAETRVTLPGQSHPDRDELGFNDKVKWPVGYDGETKSDPWRDCRFLHLANPRSAQEFTLVVDNYHGRDAIGVLKDQIRNARTAHPSAVPIIKLAAEQRRTKYGSLVWRPLFVVVDWHVSATDSGPVVRDASPPQIEPPETLDGEMDDAIPF
jgi:hypothetical protein